MRTVGADEADERAVANSAELRAMTGIDVLDKPVTSEQKSAYVRGMFDAIARRYDLLNTLLSLGIHRAWREFAVRCAALTPGNSVLDCCAGTGELSAAARKKVGGSGQVISADFSLPMLQAGSARYLSAGCVPIQVDVLSLPFADNSFDAVLVAFGLRNVADPIVGISEMARVVRPGGRVIVLEFAEPRGEWFKRIFALYSKYIMPALGGLISGRREAYSYLPESVKKWLTREELRDAMRGAGLMQTRYVDLTLGVACVHRGIKQ